METSYRYLTAAKAKSCPAGRTYLTGLSRSCLPGGTGSYPRTASNFHPCLSVAALRFDFRASCPAAIRGVS
jgi:hypothetical protein